MVLGDNLFFGHGLAELLALADARGDGGTVFDYRVADPERYHVVGFDSPGPVREIIDAKPPSSCAVTGFCFLDGTAAERASRETP